MPYKREVSGVEMVLVTTGIAAMMAVAACFATGAEPQEQTLQIEGSTTVGPIAEAFAEAFMRADPRVRITVRMTGRGNAAAASAAPRKARSARILLTGEVYGCTLYAATANGGRPPWSP